MSWIQTVTGKHFNFINTDPASICIEDIAAALSNICRFTGHLPDFYSVAQHSVHVSYLVPAEFALEGLLHDAQEAYCSDINSPLKSLLPDYREVEERIDTVIRRKYGLPPAITTPVKYADLIMLATERRDFDLDDGTPWPCLEGIPCAGFTMSPLNPRQARVLFLQRYNELGGDSNVKSY
ncbi:HD family hydrolase [Erwinia pyrifoliae]|uniref:HD family hydrolase n=1 Tax=Erwinia pyrifoliae TaxID=79967 RepID=UPI00223A7CB5|nr:HD family hydrolase [Erwinia pyrifoliae]MCT2385141.1 HD family hydrolase [Erwinia pyrifoliae]MCU8585635.1 HD family hydrolase [Erwinia pyrifoliae]